MDTKLLRRFILISTLFMVASARLFAVMGYKTGGWRSVVLTFGYSARQPHESCEGLESVALDPDSD